MLSRKQENKNTSSPKLWNTAKAALRRKSIVYMPSILKKQWKIREPRIDLKKLEEEYQSKPKESTGNC